MKFRSQNIFCSFFTHFDFSFQSVAITPVARTVTPSVTYLADLLAELRSVNAKRDRSHLLKHLILLRQTQSKMVCEGINYWLWILNIKSQMKVQYASVVQLMFAWRQEGKVGMEEVVEDTMEKQQQGIKTRTNWMTGRKTILKPDDLFSNTALWSNNTLNPKITYNQAVRSLCVCSTLVLVCCFV